MSIISHGFFVLGTQAQLTGTDSSSGFVIRFDCVPPGSAPLEHFHWSWPIYVHLTGKYWLALRLSEDL